MTRDTAMRRVPKQARSQQRVQHLLQTAALVFAEVGFEPATTNQIAARAGVPIGSLYQFFPDKEAMLAAILAQYAEEMRMLMADPAYFSLPLEESIRRLVQAMLGFELSHVGFKALFLSSGTAPQLHQDVVTWVGALMAHHMPHLTEDARDRAARVAVAIVKGLMPLSGPPDNLPPEWLGEAMVAVLLGYLRQMGIP